MCARGLCRSRSKRFLYQCFKCRSINACLIRSPYVPYVFPLSIPLHNWIPCYGFPLLFFSQLWLQNQSALGFIRKGLKLLNIGFVPIFFFFFVANINARSIGTYPLIGVNMKYLKENLLDLLTAVGIGLALCIGLLSYFDVLFF